MESPLHHCKCNATDILSDFPGGVRDALPHLIAKYSSIDEAGCGVRLAPHLIDSSIVWIVLESPEVMLVF
jgi:hypothetical protein